jgi:membrane-bound lytic murein transglycosylase B
MPLRIFVIALALAAGPAGAQTPELPPALPASLPPPTVPVASGTVVPAAVPPTAAPAAATSAEEASAVPAFDVWLEEVRAEAAARGISAAVIERALTGIEPSAQILERDRNQAEFALTLDGYLKRRLTRNMVRAAQGMRTRHAGVTDSVSEKYGVPARVLIAIWGLESNFGRFAGVRPTVPTLATLAYDSRRGPRFRTELFHALEIVERGDLPLEQLKGSWAGALGQPQFMPSSYLLYAQDFDGDGRRDIWQSHADVFASIAYYLQQHGWAKGELWGRELKVTPAARKIIDDMPRRQTGCRAQRVMTEAQPLSEWRRLGLRTTTGSPIPAGDLPASIVDAGSRAFLVYRNYDALLAYNCSHNYALSVALLADRLP